MAKQVIMPQLGESVVEATLTKWLKSKGERVKEFEPLLEINTDKVDTELPSPASGVVLDILVPEGTTARVGALLAWIGEPGEVTSDAQGESPFLGPESTQTLLATPSQAEPLGMEAESQAMLSSTIAFGRDLPAFTAARGDRESGFISPLVRRMASEHNIDLSRVAGTGLGGRITKQDVLNFLQTRTLEKTDLPGDEFLPLSPVRRAIAEHMIFSKHTSPHVTTVMEVDMSKVIAHRQANKERFARDGVNLTLTAYFVGATAMALKAYPIVNSSWSENGDLSQSGIIVHRDVHIGMATSLGEAGLIVPVIKNADDLSLLGLARAINDLAMRARNRQLKPDEVKGGTFTITNHGISGSLVAMPIINQPQCAILGVGAIQKRVVVVTDSSGNDAMAIRPMVYLSLTFDHRILDGAQADAFLSKVVELLELWN